MFLVLSLKNAKRCILPCVLSGPWLYARFTASPATKREQIYLGTHFPATAEQVFTASPSCRGASARRQKRDFYLAWSSTACLEICVCVYWCEVKKKKKKVLSVGWRMLSFQTCEKKITFFLLSKNVLKSFTQIRSNKIFHSWHAECQCPLETLRNFVWS